MILQSPSALRHALFVLIGVLGGGTLLLASPVLAVTSLAPGESVTYTCSTELTGTFSANEVTLQCADTPVSTPVATATASPSPSTSPTSPSTASPTPSGGASTTPSPSPIPTPIPTPTATHVHSGQSLQAAIDATPAGGTVVVHSGTYGPVTISKALSLIEASGETAVVSGGTDAITVTGSNVLIEGLTVRDAAEYGIDLNDASDVTIRNIEATKNGTGIRVEGWNSHRVHVTGAWLHHNDKMIRNTSGGNDDFGANAIKWRDTNGPHSITDSEIHGHRADSLDYGVDGGAFELFNASGVTIEGNTTHDNNVTYEIGSQVGHEPRDIAFRNNHVSGGPELDKGFMIRGGANSEFTGNTIDGIDWWAFFVRNCAGSTFCSPIDGLRIENNTITGVTAYKLPDVLPSSVVIDNNQASNPGRVVAEYLGTKYNDWCAFSNASGYDASTAC